MDILAHAIWGAFGAKGVNRKLTKEGKGKVNPWAVALWSIIPDLLAFLVPVGWMAFLAYRGIAIPTEAGEIYSSPYNPALELSETLYSYSHSFLVFGAFFAIFSFFKKRYFWPMLGWPVHILIDMLTHSSGTYPARIFFPLSDFAIRGPISWMNPYFMVTNYILMIFVFIYFLIKKKSKNNVYSV